jgi:cytidine deaminase
LQTSPWDETLSAFPGDAHELLEVAMRAGGVVEAPEVEELTEIMSAETGTLMIQLLPVAARFAIVPISDFRVGAVAQGMPISGSEWTSLYLGANVEFLRETLSFGVHGEQSATTNAWLNGEVGLQSLAISAAPCGSCRQFLHEIVTEHNFDILFPTGSGDDYTVTPLSTFLPDAFGPRDLGVTGGLMDPEHQNHDLVLSSGSTDPLVLMALDSAKQSYAPYTRGFAGCAIETGDGSMYPGRYAENAAFNPSMSPIESAITFMNMSRPQGSAHDLARAVLVEVLSKTGQRGASTAALASFASGISLEYHQAVEV